MQRLLSHKENTIDLNLYIIYEGFSDQEFRQLKSLTEKYDCQITFANLNLLVPSLKNPGIQKWAGSLMTYSRLFIDVLFPQLNRAIYIDSDAYINHELSSL